MDHSPLKKLPPELREMIYVHLIESQYSRTHDVNALLEKHFTVKKLRKAPSSRSKDLSYKVEAIALARTCRELYTEVRPLYLSMNTFVMTVPVFYWDHRDYLNFRELLGRRFVQTSNNFVLDFGRWTPFWTRRWPMILWSMSELERQQQSRLLLRQLGQVLFSRIPHTKVTISMDIFPHDISAGMGKTFVLDLNQSQTDIESYVDNFFNEMATAHRQGEAVRAFGRMIREQLSMLYEYDDWVSTLQH